jgi:excisionase family DNA binding protein
MPDEQFFTLEEVAERLRVDVQTVRRWIKAGKLAAYKPGREYRIPNSTLEDFLENHSYPKVQAPLSPSEEAPEERRSRYLRAWRAFVWKLAQRWEQEPPKSEREIGIVLDTMQVLLDEGAFERPAEEITTADMREASEWMDLQMIFRGLERLNRVADTVETNAAAERRRAAFEVIEGRMSA